VIYIFRKRIIIIIIIIVAGGISLKGFQHGTIALAGTHICQKCFRNMARNAY
jgi:hypothetical protein